MPHVVRNRVAVYYERLGAGPPVLLHPGLAGDRTLWAQAGYLAELSHRQVILFDPRGRGRSGRPQRPEDHAIAAYVGDALSVLEELGIAPAVIAGWGDGARVGLALAARRPSWVSGVIVLGSAADAVGRERQALAGRVRSQGMEALLKHIGRREGRVVPPWLESQIRSTDPLMCALALQAWEDGRHDYEALAPPQVPVLFLIGEQGGNRVELERLGRALPRGAARILPEVGALGVLLRPDLSLPPMLEFLEQTRAEAESPAAPGFAET